MGGTRLQGIVLRGVGGFYYAMDEAGNIHTIRAQGKLRREHMKPMVGDHVEMIPGNDEENGWILKILERKTQLVRPPVANVDTVLIVLAAASPDPDPLLAERLMVNARRAGLNVRLAINKCDLNPDGARSLASQYAGADVAPMAVCAKTGEGVEALRLSLRGTIHALAGQSGAGKSSLINALYGLGQETGAISRKIERGKNTTRHCELLPLGDGGMVLDTPGFSLLETELFDPSELKTYYPEFQPMEGQCYFQGCMHASEPKCAVRDAVNEGKINSDRHARYVALLDEMKTRWRNRYD